MSSGTDHWPLHARRWSLVGPPLRPCAEDLAFVATAVTDWAGTRDRSPDVLVLGVTPELVGVPLPAGATVLAVDREPAMIDALFAPGTGRRALAGEWLALPVPDASIDLVLGDGVCCLFGFPDDHHALARELARVLRPGGRAVLRLFVAPEQPETLADVRAALPAIRSFDALKWRIAMAIQSPARAVHVAAIRDAFDALVPDRDALAAAHGWRREVIDHVDIYRDSPAIYSFPTLAEVRAAFAPSLVEIARSTPGYELGERCPTLVLGHSSTSAPFASAR